MIIGSPCPYVCDNKSPLSGYCNSTACINPQFNGSGTYVLKMCEYCNKATYMKEEETVCKYCGGAVGKDDKQRSIGYYV